MHSLPHTLEFKSVLICICCQRPAPGLAPRTMRRHLFTHKNELCRAGRNRAGPRQGRRSCRLIKNNTNQPLARSHHATGRGRTTAAAAGGLRSADVCSTLACPLGMQTFLRQVWCSHHLLCWSTVRVDTTWKLRRNSATSKKSKSLVKRAK